MIRTRRLLVGMTAAVGLATAGLGQAVAAAPAPDLKAQVAERLGVPVAQLEDGVRINAVGLTQVKFQQEVDGVPVLGAQGVATLGPEGDLLSISGRVETTTTVAGAKGRSALSKGAAQRTAIGHASKVAKVPTSEVTSDSGRAVLVDKGLIDGAPSGKLTPAIQFALTSADGSSGNITVDRFTGAVLVNEFGKAQLNRVVCDRDGEVGTPACTHEVATRAEGDPATGLADTDRTYELLGGASGWFDQVLGVDLTDKVGADVGDGNGKALRVLTNGCYISCPDAAWWNWDSQTMYLGEGFAQDDVVAHELGHGVSQAHGIAYVNGGPSSAIQEHMSDVFGESYDQSDPLGLDRPQDKWLIGEDVEPRIGRIIRDMEDPGSLGDPERYSEYVDGGSGHSNAGIGNKTAFLIADGDSYNGQDIRGIGTTKMVKLFYAVNAAMTSHPTYPDEGALLKSQCEALTTTGALKPSDCTNVRKAIKATEIDTGSGGGVGNGRP